MRSSLCISFIFMVALVITVFQVEQYARLCRDNLIEANQQLEENLHEIHVLKAEWAYLVKPSRLEKLSKLYLTDAPISAKQVSSIETIELKPVMVANEDTTGSNLVNR